MSAKRRRRRSSARTDAAPAAAGDVGIAEPAGDPYAEFEGRDWGFAFLPDTEPEVVNEKALHRLVKTWRHGRATKTLWQAFSDAYFAVFTVVLLGAMVTNAIIGSQRAAASCTTADCDTGRSFIPWGTFFVVIALGAAVARLFGPVLASAAEGGWVMSAPIGRVRLLRPRLYGVVAGAGFGGAALAAVVAALAGEPLPAVVAWAAATGLAAGAVVAFAASEQSRERTWVLRALGGLATALALVALAGMVAVSAGWVAVGAFATPDAVVAALGAVALVVGIVGFVLARLRLDRIPRARLISGGSLVSGMQGAMFGLDFGLVRDILVEREAAARGHVTTVRGRGVGTRALIWRDLQRLARFPRPLVGVLGSALVPYTLDAVGLGLIAPLGGALALVAALVPTLGALRVLSRTGGLARAFPFSTRQLRQATVTVSALLAVVWALLVTPSMMGILGGVAREPMAAALTALGTAAAGLLGAVRWQTAKPVDFATPMVATASGAVPPSLVFNLARGFDMVALVTAPILLGLDPIWSLAVAAVVGGFLIGGANTAEMAAEAEEQRKQLAAEKGQAAKAPAATRRKIPNRRR